MKLKSSREEKECQNEPALLDNNQHGTRPHLDQLRDEQLGLLDGKCAEGGVGEERDGRGLAGGHHVGGIENKTDLR